MQQQQRAYVASLNLRDTRVAAHKIVPTIAPSYFMSWGIFISHDELGATGGESIGDLRRAGQTCESLVTLLGFLRTTYGTMAGEQNQYDCFFIRVPDVGIFIIVAIVNFEFAQRWAGQMAASLRQSSMASLRKGRKVRGLESGLTYRELMKLVAGTIHPRYPADGSIQSPLIETSENATNLTSFFAYVQEQANQFTSGSRILDADEDDQDVIQAHNDFAEVAQLISFGYGALVAIEGKIDYNSCPFVMLHPGRVFHSELIAKVKGPGVPLELYSALCPDLCSPGVGIWQSHGRIDFSQLHKSLDIFTLTLDDIHPDYYFPDVLPRTNAEIATLYRCPRDPVLDAIATFITSTPNLRHKTLCKAILRSKPVSKIGMLTDLPGNISTEDFLLFNPATKYGCSVGADADHGSDLHYMRSARADLENTLRTHFDQHKASFVSSVETILLQMRGDMSSTPPAYIQMARTICTGLETVGLHFLPPTQRPTSDEHAWMYWLVEEFEKLGTSSHHISIILRAVMCLLTTQISSGGGTHFLAIGMPGDGKTHTVGIIMKALFPHMDSLLGISAQALQSREGNALRDGLCFIDELNKLHFEGERIEIMKAFLGVTVLARRLQNRDFLRDAEPCSLLPGGVAVLACSNHRLEDICGMRGSAVGVEAAQRGSRTKASRRAGGQRDAASASRAPVEKDFTGAEAVYDRFSAFRLPPSSATVGEMFNRAHEVVPRDVLVACATNARFYLAIVNFVCVLIKHGLIPKPVHIGHSGTLDCIQAVMTRIHRGNLTFTNRAVQNVYNIMSAATVAEHVFERMVQGGPGGSVCKPASVTQFAELVYDVALGLVPSWQNLFFATGLVMDSRFTGRDAHGDGLASRFFDLLEPKEQPIVFENRLREHTFTREEVYELFPDSRATADLLLADTEAMVGETVPVLDDLDVPRSVDGGVAPVRVHALRVDEITGTITVSNCFLQHAISTSNLFERALWHSLHRVGLFTAGLGQPVFYELIGNEGTSLSFHQLIRALYTGVGAFPDMAGANHDYIASWIIKEVRKRFAIGVLCLETVPVSDPTVRARVMQQFDTHGYGDDPAQMRPEQISKYMVEEEPRVTSSCLFLRTRVQIRGAYIRRVYEKAEQLSLVERVLARSMPPGVEVMPVCIPFIRKDGRLPTVIQRAGGTDPQAAVGEYNTAPRIVPPDRTTEHHGQLIQYGGTDADSIDPSKASLLNRLREWVDLRQHTPGDPAAGLATCPEELEATSESSIRAYAIMRVRQENLDRAPSDLPTCADFAIRDRAAGVPKVRTNHQMFGALLASYQATDMIRANALNVPAMSDGEADDPGSPEMPPLIPATPSPSPEEGAVMSSDGEGGILGASDTE